MVEACSNTSTSGRTHTDSVAAGGEKVMDNLSTGINGVSLEEQPED